MTRSPTRGRRLPLGTLTFLFTDIEGSTQLLQALGPKYRRVLEHHHEILRTAISRAGGIEINTEGDAFFAVFRTAIDGLNAAVAAQRQLAKVHWPTTRGVRVRMGLHTGEGRLGGDSYVGIDVHRAARISAAGHGGQIVISDATRALIGPALPDGVSLRDLGEHRLKDLAGTEHLYDVAISGLSESFPALRTLSARPSNLPAELTSFVGRKREIGDIMARLESARLVTLTGPGGTGKTRLALEVAHRLIDRFPAGRFLVDLAPISDSTLVPSAIAHALGVAEDPSRPFLERVVDRLSQHEILLVLDNFEHLLPSADVVSQLLDKTAAVRVLATSRASLGLYGEVDYAVPSLGVPEYPPETATDPKENDAIALFVERARSSKADFAVSPENLAAIWEVCRKLDGLPLAIELAAGRLNLLSPEALLARLEQGLSVVASGPRDRPQRQQTLIAAIDWSYQLLDGPRQRMLDRLSVFVGGFGLEAAQEVVNSDRELNMDSLEGISSLVDINLVRAVDQSGGQPRFALLETIRQFARERLSSRGEELEIQARHARYFLALAEKADRHLRAADQAGWFDRLSHERDNLRAAVVWAVRVPNAEVGFRLSAALWRFWQQRGQAVEGRAQVAQLLELPFVPAALRVLGLGAAGSLAYWQGDQPATESAYDEALALARELGDRAAEIEGLYNLSFAAILAGDYARAGRLLLESRELAEQTGNEYRVALADGAMVWLNLGRGDYAAVIERGEPALAALRERGDVVAIGSAAAALAQASRLMGDTTAAAHYLLEALGLLRAYTDLPITGRLLIIVAATLEARGDHADALRIWGAMQAIHAEIEAVEPPAAAMKADGVVNDARSALGEIVAERMLEEGRHLTPEVAVALATRILQAFSGI